MKQSRVLDVRQYIDEHPFGSYQIFVVATCALLMAIDGFDAQGMGYIAPALAKDLGFSRAVLGPVFSSGLAGLTFGALICGPLADRFGRKPVLVFSTFMFGVFSLITTSATTVEAFLIFRFITGLGLGGAAPTAIALSSEYVPRKMRVTAVTTVFCGYSLGAALGGFAAAALIEQYGWQSVFVVGGAAPILIAIFLIFALPESIRFLLIKGGDERKARAERYVQKISPNIPPHDELSPGFDEHAIKGNTVKALFTDGRTKLTLLLWIMFFMNILVLNFMNSWLPTMMSDSGVPLQTAILITTLFQIGGTVGALLMGRLIDRWRSFKVLAAAYFSAAICMFFVGEAGSSVALLVVAVFTTGFCVIGAQNTVNAFSAEQYPTAIRSTGVGWALGVGRFGSIIGPTVGGILLAMSDQVRHVFWWAAIPVLIATAAAITLAMRQNKEEFVGTKQAVHSKSVS